MGQTISARILFAALFAALVIISLFCKPWLVHWLSTRTIDQLYAILDWSLWAVIIGVIVEEWELVPKVWKFSRLVWIGDTKQACSKLRKHT
jgi:predicted benzoate:H+ symporter BenE